MKKIINTLCLGALVSFSIISCSQENSMVEPVGPQKSEANAKKGAKGKVTICHQTGSGSVTITVSVNALDAHMKHGDFIGECSPFVTPE